MKYARALGLSRVSASPPVAILAASVDAVEDEAYSLPLADSFSASATFRRLTSGLVERLEVVVRFLAILELYKQGLVELDQAERFGDIMVVWTGGESVDATAGLAGVGMSFDDYEG